MSKHNPPHGGTGGNKGGGQSPDHHRSVTGNVEIRGRVEADVPPKLIDEYKASNSNNDKRENKRFIVECVTLLLLFTVGVFNFIQTRQSIKSADAAKSAADIARQTLEAANRPWITAKTGTVSPLQFSNAGASVTITFSLKNIGHSPAISPQLRADIVTLPEKTWQSAELRQAIKDECNKVGDSFAGSPHLIPTLFPDDSATLNFPAGINHDGIKGALSQTQSGMMQHPGFVRLYVVACVDYKWSYASSLQQTGYGFQLGTPSVVGYMGDIQAQGTHPEVKLIFLDDVAQ